jgi:hypothetical protein
MSTSTGIGLFFLGCALGLLVGLVIHDAFKAWEEFRDDPRKPW